MNNQKRTTNLVVRFRLLLAEVVDYCAASRSVPPQAVGRTSGSNPYTVHTAKRTSKRLPFLLVGGGGFEPPKSETSDLQSDAFGHSANRPCIKFLAAFFQRR